MEDLFYSTQINGYDCYIKLEKGKFKVNCLCKDFEFRQVHKDPVGYCKHIKEAIILFADNLEKMKEKNVKGN